MENHFPVITEGNDLAREAYEKLQRKYRKLKQFMKEYKVLNKVI